MYTHCQPNVTLADMLKKKTKQNKNKIYITCQVFVPNNNKINTAFLFTVYLPSLTVCLVRKDKEIVPTYVKC